jgi:DNA mismatch repair protein MutS2
MDEKTLITLEYPKILERLATYTAFAASAERARLLRPTAELGEARRRQTETSEAVRLLATHPDLSIGGARDVRLQVDLALHGGVLTPVELLDVKSTLVAARNLIRLFDRLVAQFPYLSDIAARLPAPPGLIDVITRAISDRGDVLDSASVKLATIHTTCIVRHTLLTKMRHMVSDRRWSAPTGAGLLFDRRYVLPLRAEFEDIHAILRQSASGATLFVEPLGVVS